jgi:hypothetical protein
LARNLAGVLLWFLSPMELSKAERVKTTTQLLAERDFSLGEKKY